MNEQARIESPVHGLTVPSFERILEHVPAAVLLLRPPDWTIIYANACAEALGGRRLPVGAELTRVFPEFSSSGVLDRLLQVISTRQQTPLSEARITLQRSASEDRELFVSGVLQPLDYGADALPDVLCCVHDVTEQVRARGHAESLAEALAFSEARARRLQESGVIGVVLWTKHGELVGANDAFLNMVGYSREELERGELRWPDMTPPEYAARDAAAIAEMDRTGVCTPYEKAYIAKDGRQVPIMLGVAYWEGRQDSGVAWILDMTERRRTEAERDASLIREQQARAAAEEASRAKDEFLSTLSHELRTPLNAIIGWATLLRTGSVTEEQRARAIETIDRNARVQARLVDDMLDLSRIVQGKLVLSVAPIELVRVIDSALESIRPSADAKGIRLEPVLDTQATIVGDADRLQQVVWNVLSNAVKFTPRGGRIEVRLERSASHIELTVSDTGEGIAPELLPHVFDRFWQADRGTTRRSGGLGLGLAIVRSLVELHGGTVSVFSSGTGLGTTVLIVLPMGSVRPEPSATTEAPVRTFEAPQVLQGLRVLVVDDEQDTRDLLGFLLTQCGCHVTSAPSAGAALELLLRARVDVIVSDVGMPGQNGYEFIKQVRSLPPPLGSTPALALTAYARAEDRSHALISGFNMHLPKPVETQELLVVVAYLAGGYRPTPT